MLIWDYLMIDPVPKLMEICFYLEAKNILIGVVSLKNYFKQLFKCFYIDIYYKIITLHMINIYIIMQYNMGDTKKLLNQLENKGINDNMEANDDIEESESRYLFIDELLKVLSKASWENRNLFADYKKELNEALKKNVAYDIDTNNVLNQILDSSPDAQLVAAVLDMFSGLKIAWLWNEEKAREYLGGIDRFDDYLRKVAKRFVPYANHFSSHFEQLWLNYLRTNKKVPTYIYLLNRTFTDYLERNIKTYLKNMEISEERCKEWFWEIQEYLKEKWFDLDASDNIKQSFIKLCREKYPLAKKSCDFLFDNKNFKKDCLNLATAWLRDILDQIFQNIIKDDEKYFKTHKVSAKENDYNVLAFMHVVDTLAAIHNLIDEWTWDDSTIGRYFLCIANEFEDDHLKKLKRTQKTEMVPTKKVIWKKSLIPEKPKSTRKDTLSDKENDLIKKAVSHIDCEWKNSIIKYITKLKIKDLPLNFYDFKKLFGIKDIPPKTERILIDELWMDYAIEEEIIKAKEEEETEKKSEWWEEQNTIPEIIEIKNPTQYLIDKLKSVWCVFDNELTAKKQIDEFCQNDDYKTVLINLMTNPRFGKVFLHKSGHRTARLLRIGMTWWRLLFTKGKDGNLHFVCFANHDTYEDRLAMLK